MTDAAAVAAVRSALSGAVPAGAGIVLAVSGGADSTGMAHLVTAARPDLVATVVHVRHGLRGDDADVAAAKAHADALGLPFTVAAVVVAADGSGPEDAARRARYDALAAHAQARKAAFVAVGHTADDQAETVLLNIARGSGLPGLAGMRQIRALTDAVAVVRPLLDLRRSVVRAVASATGLPVAQDPTNDDPDQRRARARHDLLPLLADLTGAASDPVASLARLARAARDDSTALDDLAAAEVRRTIGVWGPAVTVSAPSVDALPAALATRVVRMMVGMVAPGHPPSRASVDAVLALEDGQVATLHDGVRASRGGGRVALAGPCVGLPVRRLAAPDDQVDLPELGMALQRGSGEAPGTLPPWAPAGAAPAIPVTPDAAIVVRSRCPGDRIRTAAGTQSVADAMIDAGVPRVARDLVPVVADDAGPLWVPGVAVRADAAGHLRLRLAPLGAK